ncbi:MAG: type I glutamate--ammonia ligase [Candidatus Schekmanbacteria bacterium]|nr:type I glutamate--ammonia ligase [Candidatus Schekmanbacteria bacterium]
MTPREVVKLVEDNNVQFIDFKFMDFPGLWQHFSVPARQLTEDSFQDGFGFDGSSIRGWKSIDESDMLLLPDPTTAFIDPFAKYPTVSLIGNVVDPVTREPYNLDPRHVAQKAEKALAATGIADTVFFGPEAEFFILDDIRFDTNEHSSYYYVDSDEGKWNSGRQESPNLGYKPRYKEGYFPVPPSDTLADLRSEMTFIMQSIGIDVECHHHEVATAGQTEIDMRFDQLTAMADKLMVFKYIIKNVARRAGKTVTFMPKPLFGDNGSGMHCHQSLWKDGKPLFAGESYAGLSEMALHYIGGLLKHAPAILAFAAPTTNSYKRLVPGYEAPINLAYSRRNRSAAVRIPLYSTSPKAKRLEFRPPDPSCNPYLAFSAMLLAGIDGVLNRIDPGDPLDKDIYALSPEELKNVPKLPGSLDEALQALEMDHEFLMRGNVFTEDVIDGWIRYKRKHEILAIAMRPHPYEFALYFDI